MTNEPSDSEASAVLHPTYKNKERRVSAVVRYCPDAESAAQHRLVETAKLSSSIIKVFYGIAEGIFNP